VAAEVLCLIRVEGCVPDLLKGFRGCGTLGHYLDCAFSTGDCSVRLPAPKPDDDWAYRRGTLDPGLADAVEVATPGLVGSGCPPGEIPAVAAALVAAPTC